MGCAYKNFWSLNTDEAIVTGILRNSSPKNAEVFMPANAQMKGIDLILMNMVNKKTVTIQVKGSRAYEPKESERLKYENGSAGWFYFKKNIVSKSMADYFIFLIHVIEENIETGRRIIKPHTLAIPTKELKILCKKYKKTGKHKRYDFFFWINPIKNKSFDYRDKTYYTTKYLDKNGLTRLNQLLK